MDILPYSMTLVLKKIYSEKELYNKLSNKYLDATKTDIENAITRLKEMELISDTKNIKILIDNYKSKSKGKKYIEQKLSQKLYEKNLIKDNLLEFENNDSLEKILQKKYETLSRKSNSDKEKNKQSLIRFGISRGFDYKDILRIIKQY